MRTAKEGTQAILDYITKIGVSHKVEEKDFEKLFHPDYTLTYFDQVIIKGRENLKPHWADIFKNGGVCRVKQLYLVAEGDKCVARYNWESEKLGLVRCVALYTFKDGLCIRQDDELIATEEQIKYYAAAKTFADNQIRIKE